MRVYVLELQKLADVAGRFFFSIVVEKDNPNYACLWFRWVTKRKGICVGSPNFTNMIIKFWKNVFVICKKDAKVTKII